MKDTDAAWLAGYIDGDGCITMWRSSSKSHRSPVIVIASTDLELLERCKQIASGWIVKKPWRGKATRPQWQWVLKGALNVIAVFKEILPYMRCNDKRNRALHVVNNWHECTPKNGWYTEKTMEKKVSFEEAFLSIGQGRKSSKHYPSSTLQRPRLRAQHLPTAEVPAASE